MQLNLLMGSTQRANAITVLFRYSQKNLDFNANATSKLLQMLISTFAAQQILQPLM